MLRVTYTSQRRDDTKGTGYSPHFADIAEKAARHNGRADISGFLLCTPTWYCQTLEGPEPAVQALLLRITADERHVNVRIISSETVHERLYAGWDMGWRHRTIENRIHFLEAGLVQDTPPQREQVQSINHLIRILTMRE